MDHIRDQFAAARTQLDTSWEEQRQAFADLSALAHRAGADDFAISLAHGRFFDANVSRKEALREMRGAFRAAVLLAEIWRP